jgi:uncharacterized protein (DUF2336 family)
MTGQPSLISELEDAMASSSDDRRNDTLRKVTDLFVGNAPNFSETQVALFDDVLGRLSEDTDVAARAELSQRLATIQNAPTKVVQRLAADDMIDVAGPILAGSNRLSESQLAALAATKGRRHMLAIAGRAHLGEPVTDALLTRSDPQVVRAVAVNASARVSDKGYETLVNLAAKDPSLTESIASREEIPQRHFRTLVAMAPEAVRRRLASINPHLAERLRHAIEEAAQESAEAIRRDYSRAKDTVKTLANTSSLTDEAVLEFAKGGQFEETVVALAVLVRLPIEAAERLLSSEPTDTLLIAAKAAGLTWPTAKHLFLLRSAGRNASPQDIENARLNFVRLKPETAKQGMVFYKARAAQA